MLVSNLLDLLYKLDSKNLLRITYYNGMKLATYTGYLSEVIDQNYILFYTQLNKRVYLPLISIFSIEKLSQEGYRTIFQKDLSI